MACKEEDEVGATETYSHSSNEVDEDLDSEAEEEDDCDEYDEDQPFWQQHWLAVVIALAATITGQFYCNFVAQSTSSNSFSFLQSSTAKHAHLEKFQRTANISFCNTLPRPAQGPQSTTGLEMMDFFIHQDHFDALKRFYEVDEAEDDDFSSRQERTYPPSRNPEFQCLEEQHQRPHASQKFKGVTFYYKSPSLEQMYPDSSTSAPVGAAAGAVSLSATTSRRRRLQQPPLEFTGFAAKFVNLSPKPVLLYWDGKGGHDHAKKLVGEIAPFESLGTATMPGHSFHVTPIFDSSAALQRWVVTKDTALVYFEQEGPEEMRQMLDDHTWMKYQRQLINQAFARDYLIASKRNWLSHFPRRFPMNHMHPAEYIGQQHQQGKFTLEVVSVTPRILVIDNFLSIEDCRTIINLSQTQGLEHSTLHSGATAQQTRDLSTRSSSNTWLPRDTNDLTERIYDNGAKVMGLDPELFQKFHESSSHHHSIAESLQVVRYKKGGEEYQPHHDFVYPSIDHRYQPSRFATLLLYLNDVPEGGETRFPRAVNNYNAQGLELRPKAGQAVLFYNMLEDGNVDDLSQHGSNPTTSHEKWLANLWVWDPIID